MWDQITPIAVEFGLTLLALAVLSVGLVFPARREGRLELGITVVGLLVLLVASLTGLIPSHPVFGGIFQTTPVARILKLLFLTAGLLVAMLSWPGQRRTDILPFDRMGEYLGLMLFSLTGMCFLVSAQELMLLYVGLELATIPAILMVALNRQELRSAEASMKYVLFSALSSGLILYGLSLVYGMTGKMFLREIAAQISFSPLAIVALALVMAGVGFKISAAPFHLWTPDTYEGAPVTVTAFLSVASKAAGFVLFYKLMAGVFGNLGAYLQVLMAILATLTMTFGNLAALQQTNLKRFLAYSSIAQAGYLMIGLTNASDLGLASVVYYLVVYLFSNLAAFAVVTLVTAATGKEDIREYTGFSEANPGLALVMMLAMFSLAGIPPLAGFLGKFYLFAAAAKQGLYWLVLVGAVNATVSLYYYLVVIKWMYLLKPSAERVQIARVELPWLGRLVLGVTAAGMVLIGILPQVIRWTEAAARGSF